MFRLDKHADGWDCDLSFRPYFQMKGNVLMDKAATLCEMYVWHGIGKVKEKHHSKGVQTPSD